MNLAFFQNIGPTELLIVLFIVLLVFGATRIPKLMRGLGQGIHEFKKGMHEGTSDEKQGEEKPPDQK